MEAIRKRSKRNIHVEEMLLWNGQFLRLNSGMSSACAFERASETEIKITKIIIIIIIIKTQHFLQPKWLNQPLAFSFRRQK